MELFENHKGKILLALAFAVMGVLFVTIGFLKTLFVVFLGGVGFLIGFAVDDREKIRKFLNNYLGR